jgi:hypothetical protein
MLAKNFKIEYEESAQSRIGAAFSRFDVSRLLESSEQDIMRSKFITQMPIGAVPISEIEFDVFCRHELVPILMALQHLYVQKPRLLDKICTLIKADISGQPDCRLGCTGLTYWEILVLSALRLGANLDYDQLSDLASWHRQVRQVMGISDWESKRYPKSTIHDNLSALSAASIQQISDLIVAEGHRLRPKAVKRLRADSYVLKKNIHYPTDANLLLDGVRKVIALCAAMAKLVPLCGWRQHAHQLAKARRIKRSIDKAARSRSKDKDQQLEGGYRRLLDHSRMIVERALDSYEQVKRLNALAPPEVRRLNEALGSELQYFLGATEYMMDLAARRVIAQEKIANDDKVFSLFEPDTELINRGKLPQPIEFGHRVIIVEDSAGFIVHARIMARGMTDEKIPVELMGTLQSRFHGKIKAASFDKGFWSPTNLEQLRTIIPLIVLPKKGKRSALDAEREEAKEFGRLRKWHAGVESAIHALQAGNGLSVCRDKGIEGYQRYLALGVLGRNLQRLGTIFVDKERKRRRKQMLRMAA